MSKTEKAPKTDKRKTMWQDPAFRAARLAAMNQVCAPSPVRELRLAYGDSQIEFLARMGLSQKSGPRLSKWENGVLAVPEKQLKTLRFLAEKKGMPFEYTPPAKPQPEEPPTEDLPLF